MIEMSIGSLIAMMGIPTAVTGFFFWLLEHRIQKREKKREQQEATARAKAEEREHAREELQLLAIQSTNAAIALAEATAKAVQRIPDAKCNGDMHAALDYAAKVKHEQKDFLTKQGIQAILDITPVVNAVIALAATVVSVFLIPWIKSKTTAQQRSELVAWAKIGVAAAEQIYVGQGRGDEKKQYVLEFLKSKGFDLNEESVNNAFEAAVKQLKTEGLLIDL